MTTQTIKITIAKRSAPPRVIRAIQLAADWLLDPSPTTMSPADVVVVVEVVCVWNIASGELVVANWNDATLQTAEA